MHRDAPSVGIEVWADDVREDLLPDLLTSQIPLCGIKIDKHTFWNGRIEQAKFLHLTRQCKRVASKVLIEGIETAGDFALPAPARPITAVAFRQAGARRALLA